MKHFRQPRDADARVTEAVRAMRVGLEQESLSPAVRAAILKGTMEAEPVRQERLADLFTPSGRIWAYGALSGVLGLFLLVLIGVPEHRPGSTARLELTKQGEAVVIAVHDGDGPHVVRRSTSPTDFESGTAHAMRNGVFTDSEVYDAGLIFYRIE